MLYRKVMFSHPIRRVISFLSGGYNFLLIRDRVVCPVVYASEIIDAYVTEIYQLSCRLFASSSATAVHKNNCVFVGKICGRVAAYRFVWNKHGVLNMPFVILAFGSITYLHYFRILYISPIKQPASYLFATMHSQCFLASAKLLISQNPTFSNIVRSCISL